MSTDIKVAFHRKFVQGSSDTEFLTDLPVLEQRYPEHHELLLDFALDVTIGQPLKGVNKPSWQDRYGQAMRNSHIYLQHNLWHCHVLNTDKEPSTYTVNLHSNYDGLGAAPAVHYTKSREHSQIEIIGFSRQHSPFAQRDVDKNILTRRMSNPDPLYNLIEIPEED